MKKGSIVDIYPEGETSFRACILEVADNDCFHVVSLHDGERSVRCASEIESSVIENIFDI